MTLDNTWIILPCQRCRMTPKLLSLKDSTLPKYI